MGLQWPHLLLLLVIVLLVFGAGRISNIMGELGKGMKSFKQGLSDEEDDARKRHEEQRRAWSAELGSDVRFAARQLRHSRRNWVASK